MATQQVEDIGTGADRVKVALAIALAIAGLIAYYALADQPMVVRLLALIGGLAAGIVVGWFSHPGRRLISFCKDSWKEVKRVVWPSKKETWTMTLYVFVFVVVMALFLWLVDKTFEWVIYGLLLGWRG